MRVNNKGGVTPRDRRPDRRKVATAATLVAVLLFATQALAVPSRVNLVVDTNLSSLGLDEQAFDVTTPLTVLRLVPMTPAGSAFFYGGLDAPFAPSNSAAATGFIAMDWDPGVSMEFVPGISRINYDKTFPYFPYRAGPNVNDAILSPPGGIGPGGVAQNAQLGFEIEVSLDGGINWIQGQGVGNIYGLYQDFGDVTTGLVDGGGVLGNVGPNSYANGTASLMALGGVQDLFGALSGDTELGTAGPGNTPFPSPFAGNIVTFDGTTLTIPMGFTLNFVDSGTDFTITTFGQIVATVVPEPSSMIMLGFGVLGLVGCFVRARKRRA